jgi:hypothetical protein
LVFLRRAVTFLRKGLVIHEGAAAYQLEYFALSRCQSDRSYVDKSQTIQHGTSYRLQLVESTSQPSDPQEHDKRDSGHQHRLADLPLDE